MISLLCESIVEFRLYDQKKIAVSIGRSRSAGKRGLWAYVVPLRYVGGKAERRGLHRGRSGFYRYHSPIIEELHPEALYLMSFLFPRFFDLTSRERLETIVHELYHLHPSMRGDLRRFPAPHVHHGPTPSQYDATVRELTEEALATSPWLASHPLIAGSAESFEEHRAQRLKIPRRVFIPDHAPAQLPLTFLGAALGLLLALLLAKPVFGQTPEEEFVDDNPEAEISRESDTSKFDQRADRYFALRKGKLFEKPSKFSERFGLIEPNDEIRVVKRSKTKKWSLIRLQLTGEEGWYPTAWIRLSREQRLSRPGPFSIDASAGFGTGGTQLGFGAGVAFNFLSNGLSSRPRDRLEIGVRGDKYFGESVSIEEGSIATKFLFLEALARYVFTADSGFYAGSVELGAAYIKRDVTSTGVDEDILADSGIKPSGKSIGLAVGLSAAYSFTPNFQAVAGVRAYLGNSFVAAPHIGVGLRF